MPAIVDSFLVDSRGCCMDACIESTELFHHAPNGKFVTHGVLVLWAVVPSQPHLIDSFVVMHMHGVKGALDTAAHQRVTLRQLSAHYHSRSATIRGVPRRQEQSANDVTRVVEMF